MTGPDLRPTLDWLSVCADAIAVGRDWRADSDRHLRTLPTEQGVTPRMFAVVIDRWERRGLPPVDALQLIDQVLNVMALHLDWHADEDPRR